MPSEGSLPRSICVCKRRCAKTKMPLNWGTQCRVYFISVLTVQSERWWKFWEGAGRKNGLSPKTCRYLLIKAIYWVAICHRVGKTNSTCLSACRLGDLHFYQPQASRLIACDRHPHDRLLHVLIFSSSYLSLYAPFRDSNSLNASDLPLTCSSDAAYKTNKYRRALVLSSISFRTAQINSM